ncbi:unnamed protein product [Prunus brigantina]
MNPIKNESPSHIVPYPGHSPITVANRFSSLGTTVGQIRPNYQSALVFRYDPFQVETPSLKYYRDILNETQSVEIKPIKDKNQPHIILYHSL